MRRVQPSPRINLAKRGTSKIAELRTHGIKGRTSLETPPRNAAGAHLTHKT